MMKIDLAPHKKVYFASDFHLGAPSKEESLVREKKIVRWLDSISADAGHVFLVGDLFDFWFEYKTVVAKGFIRFQAKLLELLDKGIGITIFVGNHDLWMRNYFPSEFGIEVIRDPLELQINNTSIHLAHGDGLGPGDHQYKFLKKVFTNPVCQWMFSWLHPDIGMGLALFWSSQSWKKGARIEEVFLGDKEWLWTYAQEQEVLKHHDYYIFGHRHLPLVLPVGENSTYINLGEWIQPCTYAVFDGEKCTLERFEADINALPLTPEGLTETI